MTQTMTHRVESAAESIAKAGEEVCGNLTRVFDDRDGVTVLLTDGEGDGTIASVTSAFFMRMGVLMLRESGSVHTAVRTVSDTYAENGVSGEGRLGFLAARLTAQGHVSFSAMNLPAPIVLKKSRLFPYETQTRREGERTLLQGDFDVPDATSLVFFSRGLLAAGELRPAGWNRQSIESFLQAAYKPKNFGAAKITQMLLSAAKSLDRGRPAHDISVLALRLIRSEAETDAHDV